LRIKEVCEANLDGATLQGCEVFYPLLYSPNRDKERSDEESAEGVAKSFSFNNTNNQSIGTRKRFPVFHITNIIPICFYPFVVLCNLGAVKLLGAEAIFMKFRKTSKFGFIWP